MIEHGNRPHVTSGSPEPRGVTPQADGVNVAVFSAHADAIDFCVFDEAGEKEIARVRLPDRTGDVFHGHVAGVRVGTRYGLRAHGRFDPGRGLRFDSTKLLVDPYALAIDRPFKSDAALFTLSAEGEPAGVDSAAAVPKAIVMLPVKAEPWRGAVTWDRVVISELHAKGFTARHPGIPQSVRGTFAGLAAPASLAHFAELGITTIEVLPMAASLDERHLGPLGLTNYWNYNPVAFMAPEPRLAPGGWDEIRETTATLNRAGIEVILDVVYNHSGEGDAGGPTVSLRGLDNASYYRLDQVDAARYVDDAGCGNILAADHPEVVRLIMDALRAWAGYGGVNGFRFDLATTLGRSRSGFDPAAALLAAIEQDPLLRPLRLIAEPWDLGPGGYQVGAFGSRWGEWNDRYRDGIRRFWRGDGTIADLATRLSGSSDKFWRKRKPSRSINFVTAHDGFTLADLVTYESKHNEANGELNRDGSDNNLSWNHGLEGPSDDAQINAARRRDQRNLLATLSLSRGTPMLGPGAEIGHTQQGNNNPYSQDNEISWIDWAAADTSLMAFVGRLTRLRFAHPALHRDAFLEGEIGPDPGLRDVEWLLSNGLTPSQADWHDPERATLVMILAITSDAASGARNRVAAVFHAGFAPVQLALPPTRWARAWRLIMDTGVDKGASEEVFLPGAMLQVPSRTVMLFTEHNEGPASGTPRQDR